MRKLRLFALFLVTIAAGGHGLLSVAQSPHDLMCGLGPPPDASEFAAFQARRAIEVQRAGYETVCEANLARYDGTSDLRPTATVIGQLDFPPVDLTATPFRAFAPLGARSENVAGVKSRLYRSFKMLDGHIVTLYENDMSADGTQIFRDPQDEPERVNALPARLVVLQAPGGKAVSVLSWTDSRRTYELWLDANVTVEQKKAQFIALAATIPKAIPAHAKE